MAKASCALCGIPLGMFEKKNLVCCGETQPFCFSCYIEMEPMDHIRRTRVLLKEGRAPLNPEAMGKVLERIDRQEAAQKQAAATDLACLRCGAPMAKMGRKRFQMGTENFFFDTHMLEGSLMLDVLRCTKCRRVEFFLPEYNPDGSFSAPSPAPEESYVTCPDCGARHDPRVGCTRCALKNAQDRRTAGTKSSPADQKPPWEK